MGKKVASEDDGARAAKIAKLAVARAATAKSKGKTKSSQKGNPVKRRKAGEGKAVTTEYRVSKVTGMRKRLVLTAVMKVAATTTTKTPLLLCKACLQCMEHGGRGLQRQWARPLSMQVALIEL
jgi:hypothetical protein